MTSGGLGPWFCALFFDNSSESSYLVNHTMPHLAQNALGTSWTLVVKVGPFSVWQACENYRLLWSMYTNKLQRLRRGVQLFCAYRQEYELSLWWTSQTIYVNDSTSLPLPPPPIGGGGGEGATIVGATTSELVQSYTHLHLNNMSVASILDAQDFMDPPKKRKKASTIVVYSSWSSSFFLFFLVGVIVAGSSLGFFFFGFWEEGTDWDVSLGLLSGYMSPTKLVNGI
jgi:hypothetical protein